MFLLDITEALRAIDIVLNALQSVRDSCVEGFQDVHLKADTLCDIGKCSSFRQTVRSTDAQQIDVESTYVVCCSFHTVLDNILCQLKNMFTEHHKKSMSVGCLLSKKYPRLAVLKQLQVSMILSVL